MTSRTRSVRVLVGTLIVYALLVAPHEGEFWPFSIYPMFSQGGNPWSRAVVYDVTDNLGESGEPLAWETVQDEDALPGKPFALGDHSIDPIDLSNFVSKTEIWHAERVQGLRQMFHDHVGQRDLLVVRVNGRITAQDSVVVEYVPYALLRDEDTELHSDLPTAQTPQ